MSGPRYENYDRGDIDFHLMANYGIMPHVKGVMYRPREPKKSGYYCEAPLHQSIVVEDVCGDYYDYHQDPWAGDVFVARFRSPRGTMPEDFVKNHFRGAVMGVDMDQIHPYEAYGTSYLAKEQAELVKQREEVESQSGCACSNLLRATAYKSKFNNCITNWWNPGLHWQRLEGGTVA